MMTFEPTPLGFLPQFMLENGHELRWGVRGCLIRVGGNLATIPSAPISSPLGDLIAAQSCGVRRPA